MGWGVVGSLAGAAKLGGLTGLIKGGGGGGGGISMPSIPKFAMKKTEDFVKNDPSVQVGGPNATNAINRRFNAIRESTSNRIGAAGRDNAQAMQRKFASQGLSGSGAEIAAMQKLNDQEAGQKADVLAQVDIAESGELSNQALAQADMDFKQRVFNFERGSKMHELDLAERQQQQDAVATEINALVAKEQTKEPKKGLLGGLIDGLL